MNELKNLTHESLQAESMVVACNIEGNQHMRCHCENCGAGFIE